MAATSISIFTSKELQVTVGLLKSIDKDLSREIRRAVKSISTPEWTQEVQANVRFPIHQRVLASNSSVTVGNDNVRLRSGNSTRRLSGGASPSQLARAAEFGADRNSLTTYIRTSPKGNRHKVTRHASRQLPTRSRSGWAVYPAAAEITPRIASLYAQTTLRTFAETIEKGGR
jgi:hypothetical protein